MRTIESKVRVRGARRGPSGKSISGERDRDSPEIARRPTGTDPLADSRLTLWFKELRARAASSDHRVRAARPDPQS